MKGFFAAALLASAAVPAAAQVETVATSARGGLLAGARFGAIVPFNGLSSHAAGGLEAGWVFGAVHRSFAVTLGLEYAAPMRDGSQTDPRVSGGRYDWHLTQEMLTLTPLFLYRMTWVGGRLTPYAGVGPRFYFLKSTVRGSAIGETTEQSSKVGLALPLGLEVKVGPGAFTLELLLQHADIEHTATAGARNGAATFYLGYRFLL